MRREFLARHMAGLTYMVEAVLSEEMEGGNAGVSFVVARIMAVPSAGEVVVAFMAILTASRVLQQDVGMDASLIYHPRFRGVGGGFLPSGLLGRSGE
jgi:hypothetical protein